MTEVFLSWQFLLWVAIPIVFRYGADFLEKYRPQLFVKYRRKLTLAMVAYFFLVIVIPGMVLVFVPPKEKTVLPTATPSLETTIQEEQAAKDFFKEPPEPKKGQGAGFPGFSK